MNLLTLNEGIYPQIFAKLAVNRGVLPQSKALQCLENSEFKHQPKLAIEFLTKNIPPEQAAKIQKLLDGSPSADLTVLSEEEVQQKVAAGESLENVYLDDLNLEGLTLIHPLSIRNSVVNRVCLQETVCLASVDFSGTLFLDEIHFGSSYERDSLSSKKIPGMRCMHPVSFDNAIFLEEADFSEITFQSDVSFNRCHFYQGADFRACLFAERVEADEVLFVGKTVFQNSTFTGKTTFRNALFQNESVFSEAVFLNLSNFFQAQFYRGAIFNGCIFDGEANFSECLFQDEVAFEDCRFKSGSEFQQSQFNICRLNLSEFEGWADFFGATFRGDFIAFETLFNKGLDFSETVLKGELDFQNAKILGDMDFSRFSLEGKARFEGSQFQGKVSFRKARFSEQVDFNNVKVNKDFYVEEAHFLDAFECGQTLFLGTVHFRKTEFHSFANFSKTSFGQKADFSKAIFNQKTLFRQSHFADVANFRKVKTRQFIDFSQSGFQKNVIFTKSQFQMDVSFHKTEFFEEALFEECTFFGKVHFTNIRFHKLFSLKMTDCKDKVFFNQSSFQQVSFEKIAASEILLRQSQIEGKLFSVAQKNSEVATQEFGFLKSNFESQNLYDEMDWAYYHFKKFERKAKQHKIPFYNPFPRIPLLCDLLIYDWGCGYCTKPFRLVFSGLVIVLLFAFAFQVMDPPNAPEYSRQIIFSGEEFEASEIMTRPFEQYFYFSFCNFVALGAGDTHANYHGLLKYCAALEAMVGLFFVTLFVTTFTRKVLR